MKRPAHLPPLDDFKIYTPHRSDRLRTKGTMRSVRSTLTKGQKRLSLFCRILAAAIMVETLFFKFTGAPESVYIFSKLGLESWWRYGQGIWELLASLCLLIPGLIGLGGVLTLGAIGAAILSHLTLLGIEVQGDRGLLFAMALTVFACGLITTYLHRRELPNYTSLGVD